MSGFEHETISMDDLRAGFGIDLLADAEVIIAVDADAQEEAIYGEPEWEIAVNSGQEAELAVVRVELEASEDAEELREMIAAAQSDAQDDDEDDDEPVDSDDD